MTLARSQLVGSYDHSRVTGKPEVIGSSVGFSTDER